MRKEAASLAAVLDLTGEHWEVREALRDTWEWHVQGGRDVAARNNAAEAAEAADAVRRRPAGIRPAPPAR